MRRELEAERDRASVDMLFEKAAALHERVVKVKAVANIADSLVQPLDSLRAVLLLPCLGEAEEPRVQVFVFAQGCLRGPRMVSLLGVRLAKEQEQVGSSLFAQPMMLAAVPLEPSGAASDEGSAEERLLAAIAHLEDEAGTQDTATLGDHLAMLRRWYYRPDKQRTGMLFQREQEAWPVRRMVRAGAKLLLPKPVALQTSDQNG